MRLKAARKFLKAGDKVIRLSSFCFLFFEKYNCVTYHLRLLFQVKIMVNLKGRENLYKKQAIELLRRFQNDVGEVIRFTCFSFME